MFHKRYSVRGMILAAAITIAGIPSAMATSVTFAQYLQSTGSEQQWSITTSGNTTTVSASGSVSFQFSGAGLPFTSSPENATFTLSATSTQIGNCASTCGAGDGLDQTGYSGTFSFIDNESNPGANLLSGVFSVTGSPATTGASFSSNINSTGGSFNASSNSGNLNQLILTSSYLDFTGQTQENASWSLSSLLPNFTTGTVTSNQAYPGPQFNASGTGTFSSNPGPVSSTPEPGTILLFGGAFACIALLRLKRFSNS